MGAWVWKGADHLDGREKWPLSCGSYAAQVAIEPIIVVPLDREVHGATITSRRTIQLEIVADLSLAEAKVGDVTQPIVQKLLPCHDLCRALWGCFGMAFEAWPAWSTELEAPEGASKGRTSRMAAKSASMM